MAGYFWGDCVGEVGWLAMFNKDATYYHDLL